MLFGISELWRKYLDKHFPEKTQIDLTENVRTNIVQNKIKPVNNMADRTAFFDSVRQNLFGGQLTQPQVDSINAILDECEKQGVTNKWQIVYILATPYHECYNPKHPETRLTPIREFGGEKYLKSKPYYPYFARGFSGLTWDYNYKKESDRLGIDLMNNPDLMLNIQTAAESHVYCMIHGSYTGKKLGSYINDFKCDTLNARRVINGTDKAELIAGYAKDFYSALT